jgi:hypothetical protein
MNINLNEILNTDNNDRNIKFIKLKNLNNFLFFLNTFQLIFFSGFTIISLINLLFIFYICYLFHTILKQILQNININSNKITKKEEVYIKINSINKFLVISIIVYILDFIITFLTSKKYISNLFQSNDFHKRNFIWFAIYLMIIKITLLIYIRFTNTTKNYSTNISDILEEKPNKKINTAIAIYN